MTSDILQTGKPQIAHAPFFAYDVFRLEFSGIQFDTGVGSAIDAQKVGALVVDTCALRGFGSSMIRSRQATPNVRDQEPAKNNSSNQFPPKLRPQPEQELIPNAPPRAHCLRVTNSSFTGGYREGVAHDKGFAIFQNDGTWLTDGYTSRWHPDEQATLALYKNVTTNGTAPAFPEAADFTRNVEVEGNLFAETGMVFSNSPALWLYRGVAHANVEDNDFEDVAHMGLYYAGAFFNIENNRFLRCARATTDIGAIDSILSLIDIGNEIHGNTFTGMQWYPEINDTPNRSPMMPFDLEEEGGERSLVKTIVSGIYFDNIQSHQRCYNNTFNDCQYAFILLGGRDTALGMPGVGANKFIGNTQLLYSERAGAKVVRVGDTGPAVLENQTSGSQPHSFSNQSGLPRVMGNSGNSTTVDYPTTSGTSFHGSYRNQRSDLVNLFAKEYWQNAGGDTSTHRGYLAAMPDRVGGTFYNFNRFPLSLSQNPAVSSGWLDLGWVGLQRNVPLNSTDAGDNQWFTLNMDHNKFYTEEEDFSGLTGKLFCGRVKLTSYNGTNLAGIPKQRLYMYMWHPSMSTTRGQKVFKTVLDEDGRFAMRLPASWTSIHVRTESGLWKKLFLDGEPVVVPSGTPTAEASFNYISWTTGTWQDLQICYGDVNGDNKVKRALGGISDIDALSARGDAEVRVLVPANGMSTFNYSHIYDLNRDNKLDSSDIQIIANSGSLAFEFEGAR